MHPLVSAFNDWANSIAALAVAKPEDRLRAVQANEQLTSIAMYAWRQHGKDFEMRKPQQIWIGGR